MKSIFFKNIFKIFFFIISTNSFSQIVINELMVRPPGTVSTPPNGLIYTNSEEYIELYNNSCSSINISGYFIAMKQNLSTINTGGTFKIPNIPAANILPGGHVVIGSASPAGSALGNIDIPITAADRCLYNGNFVLANTDGWCALYNASGVALDCVYWSSSASNLTSNTSDFNPPGGICLPAGSPVVTLQTPFQINSTSPSIVKYGGPNPSVGSPLSRQTDGANNWVQNLASSIGANNCNGGITVAPGVSPSAPTVVSPVNYCQGATATALIATPATGGVLNWYGTNATGGTATSTSPIPSTTTAPTTVIYYVSQTVGGCESPRAQIVVNVNSGGNLGLFCDTANSTATSLAFDFSNVGQTNFSYSYSINGGTPITGTHVSPSNFTVSSLSPGSSVTFTLSANGVSCVSPQTVTCSTIPVDCGSCSTPNCPILGVANYGVKNFPAVSCSNWSPALTNTVVKSYYLVQADSNGFVGLIQQANGSPPLCINRSAILRPLATSCNVASNVSPSVVNANGVASGFNPEWYGLIPNAQYIIEVTITLGVGCTLDSLCSNYYGCSVPSAPIANATIQPTCTMTTGTIVVSSPSGVGNLYSIDGINFQTSSTFSGLVPNTYSVIVKKTPSGCTSSATNITINAVPTIVAPIASATFQPTCNVGTGTIVVSSPTGINFEYSINGTTFQSSSIFSGLTPNSYNVIVKDLTTSCISVATVVIINTQPFTPAVPAITTTPATCAANGTATVSNYSAGLTYTSLPAGLTVGAGGVVTGFTCGTSYTITATNAATCFATSASFTVQCQLAAPAVPGVTTTPATCAANGTATVSNYSAGLTYTSLPAGLTVGAGGVVTGFTCGTSYTIIATNAATCFATSASFTVQCQLVAPAVPGVTTTPATCAANGTATVSNYSAGLTYTSLPAGLSVGAGGVVTGFTCGSSYTITATNAATCFSTSASFTVQCQLVAPAVPGVSTTPATCAANGTATVSNYSAGLTYTSLPAGLSVGAGGVVTGFTCGTSYTITATNAATCFATSASFIVQCQLVAYTTPLIVTTPATCSAAGSSTISNYSASNTYTFSTAGPTVGAGGLISGMTVGASYTVTATNGTCTSAVSVSFSNAAQLPSIVPTFVQVAPICSGDNLSQLPSVSTNGISGTWSPNMNNLVPTLYTFTPTGGQGCVTTQTMTIDVRPTPQFLTQVPDYSICNGDNMNLAVLLANNTTVPGSTFEWLATFGNNINSSALASAGGLGTIDQLINLIDATQPSSLVIQVRPVFGSCKGDFQEIVIRVNTKPEIQRVNIAPATICNNGSTVLTIVASPVGTVYDWVVSNVNGVVLSNGSTSGSSTSNVITMNLELIDEEIAGSLTFTITPRNGNCIGTPFTTGIINVNPIPGAPFFNTLAPICSGETTAGLLVSPSFPSLPGTEIVWEVVQEVNVTGASNGSGIAPAAILQTLTNTTNNQGYVIYSVKSRLNGCESNAVNITVFVNPKPKPDLTDGHICVDPAGNTFQSYFLSTQLSNANFRYRWFKLNTVTNLYEEIFGETNSTYEVTTEGTYQVEVTDVTYTTNCIETDIVIVSEENPATALTATVSDAFTNNSTITVTVNPIGSSSLIYSLDGGAWQDSNVFTGVEAGEHEILVSDLYGCTNLSIRVIVIDYPKYFTPNGDGIHDTWNIIELNQADAKLYIFDRYGKLIKQLSTTAGSPGWDGTYNGAQMPSTDYWFTIEFTENDQQKQFKAHFSLKR